MAHVRKLGSFKKWNWVSNRIGVSRDSFFIKLENLQNVNFLIIAQVKTTSVLFVFDNLFFCLRQFLFHFIKIKYWVGQMNESITERKKKTWAEWEIRLRERNCIIQFNFNR